MLSAVLPFGTAIVAVPLPLQPAVGEDWPTPLLTISTFTPSAQVKFQPQIFGVWLQG
ncbi:hypothetical protein Runsl_5324 [Runella slithyformis DSM 19594]|uniref:Uncharacterized protein n=1 Tax=Runella slithyformis (strain ATCC 29530 / DSM 19594 / LMG 11500 / NCIMB 11436 / LSU 4) TaxID=761193 RepID=A0A7U3ZQQ4_RUNSL|nr:hypothetical protein Runsl_5324 [Runella slithyformis DSM 19594]